MALMSSLQDPFSVYPDSRWTVSDTDGGAVTQVGGRLRFNNGAGVQLLTSAAGYDFDQASVSAELNTGPDGRYFRLTAEALAGDGYPPTFFIEVYADEISANWDNINSTGEVSAEHGRIVAAYTPATMRYLRLTSGIDTGQFYVDYATSRDGFTWQLLHRFTATPPATSLYRVQMFGEYSTSYLSNFNIAPMSTLIDAFTAYPDSRWAFISHHAGASAAIVDGQLRLSGLGEELRSTDAYLFDLASVRVQLTPDPEAIFRLSAEGALTGDLYPPTYQFKIQGDTISAYCDDGDLSDTFEDGGVVPHVSATYHPTTMRYLRMTSSVGPGVTGITVDFATSPDGTSWTAFHHYSNPTQPAYAYHVRLFAQVASVYLADFNLKHTAFYLDTPAAGFVNVGTAANPLRLRLPNGTWMLFDGTGSRALRLRAPDGTWRTVATGT